MGGGSARPPGCPPTLTLSHSHSHSCTLTPAAARLSVWQAPFCGFPFPGCRMPPACSLSVCLSDGGAGLRAASRLSSAQSPLTHLGHPARLGCASQDPLPPPSPRPVPPGPWGLMPWQSFWAEHWGRAAALHQAAFPVPSPPSLGLELGSATPTRPFISGPARKGQLRPGASRKETSQPWEAGGSCWGLIPSGKGDGRVLAPAFSEAAPC